MAKKSKASKAVLLVNVGTPENTSVGKVRRYLFEFLNDKRVIDLPWLGRALLVNLIIVPFRAPKSAKLYKELWTEQGSPLLYYGNKVADQLDEKLGDDYDVYMSMRYAKPNMKTVLKEIKDKRYDELILVPLYPHYASSTTGTTIERMMELVRQWYVIPSVRAVNQFWEHPKFLEAFEARGKEYNLDEYDHILFSYHGLPNRQLDKVHPEYKCVDCNCHERYKPTDAAKFCYRNTCYQTSRVLAERLGLKEDDYTVCFQSRLSNNWLTPFSDKVVEAKAKEGAGKLLVFSPAFVADCLETNVEIGMEYQEIFEEHGGEKVELVPSLNDHPKWIEALEDLVREG
jgi:ferrochelatase